MASGRSEGEGVIPCAGDGHDAQIILPEHAVAIGVVFVLRGSDIGTFDRKLKDCAGGIRFRSDFDVIRSRRRHVQGEIQKGAWGGPICDLARSVREPRPGERASIGRARNRNLRGFVLNGSGCAGCKGPT
jgi:hypothetical protein